MPDTVIGPTMQPSDTPAPNHDEANPTLHLAASLDLSRATALHGELQSLAARNIDMVVDGSDVEIVSTACLQLLVAAAADARRRGVRFTMRARSEVLQQSVADLGLVMHLNEEMAG
jgi:anti-anti-sigma regulatory factor